MDPLKRFEEAKLRGLNKDEYFHLMEMEVKLLEMRKQEVSAASVGRAGQSEADLQQMLRDMHHQQVRQHEKVCRGIKLILEQLHQQQQDHQDQRHNVGTQISEIYRNVDGKLESSVQQMKEELRELRAEVLNKVEGGRGYLRDTLTGVKGVKASVFGKIGEVTNSIKGNFHDVRKDIFSRVTSLEGDFLNFENGGGREPLPKPNELTTRIQRDPAREKSTSVAQFEQSDEFTSNESVEGKDSFGDTENEASQKLHDDFERKESVQDTEHVNLRSDHEQSDDVHHEHSIPNQTSEPLYASSALEHQSGVCSQQADSTLQRLRSEAMSVEEQIETTSRHIDDQPNETTDSLLQTSHLLLQAVDGVRNFNDELPQLDSFPESHVDQNIQTDSDDRKSLTSRLIQEVPGPRTASLQENTSLLQDKSRPHEMPLPTSSPQDALPSSNTSQPHDKSPNLNTPPQQDAPQLSGSTSPQGSSQQREASLRPPRDQDDPKTSFEQQLEVLERLFYVVTQQSHQLFLDTVEDKMEQTLNVIVALVTGVKHEICDVTEKEMQLVRDRLTSGPRPGKHYVCDFYVKNVRNMVYREDSQMSLPWHIHQMRSCVKGYVEVTGNGDMYVALMYGRHPSALGLAPRAGIKLKVKATVKDTTGTLPDVVVGEATWNCNEAGVKDNRAWGKKIGVLSCVSLVNQGYGEKEGYAYGSMLIRYEITVLKE
ncbi:unnamed protein product [Lymnaea stagnalis]|uniref:Uncharacterized protein n=1 Tax=Lymnaea stagnalis TaxID=6523 RepID=A0AAV2I9P8_LYMST